MTDREIHGPIDFILLEFPAGAGTGGVVDALTDLLDRGVVALYDIMVVSKGQDGSHARIDLTDAAADGFGALAGAQSGLFDDTDLDEAAAALEPNTVALLIAYENLWAVPFVTAAVEAGGQAVAGERIPAQVLIDALDSTESESTKG